MPYLNIINSKSLESLICKVKKLLIERERTSQRLIEVEGLEDEKYVPLT